MAILAAGVSSASCGGEEKLPKQEYIVQADKVCTDVEGRIKAIKQPSSTAELKGYVDKIKPLLDEAIERFEALEPADEIKGAANALVGSTREARKLADDLSQTTNEREIRRLSMAAAAREQRVDARLVKDGFKECAND